MTDMINSFLDVARLETGNMQLIPVLFSINKPIAEVVEEHKFVHTNHPVRIIECPEISVLADRQKTEHVMTNLLGNAVKYSPTGKPIEIGCRKTKDQVEVFVKDEGIGIRKDEIPKLFDRFYRSENLAGNRTISGFGTGLHLSAEIIKMHHGKIWVESEDGKGFTFYFSLPMG